MTEQQIQQLILVALGSRPDCRVWRNNSGKARTLDGKRIVTFGVPGQADISGILAGGRRLEIEVKKPGGVQSKEQRAFQRMIEAFGGFYVLAYCVDDAVRAVDQAASKSAA